MKSHFSTVSLSIANYFRYLDHHCHFITVFDLGDILMFLTKMQVPFLKNPAIWIIIFNPGGASTLEDRAFLAQLFSDRSQEVSNFFCRHHICDVIHDLIAVSRLLNGFTNKIKKVFS
ncbi:unnamed protein product [Vicia faba]|uniref:Uncharacterized protein n=1 Tax=Vicia faba TaxID=3906 RepID=A0AAV0ZTT3_VICFA|nr:unnamed protein product [Vicia faba]